jgi:hypothetical protein
MLSAPEHRTRRRELRPIDMARRYERQRKSRSFDRFTERLSFDMVSIMSAPPSWPSPSLSRQGQNCRSAAALVFDTHTSSQKCPDQNYFGGRNSRLVVVGASVARPATAYESGRRCARRRRRGGGRATSPHPQPCGHCFIGRFQPGITCLQGTLGMKLIITDRVHLSGLHFGPCRPRMFSGRSHLEKVVQSGKVRHRP